MFYLILFFVIVMCAIAYLLDKDKQLKYERKLAEDFKNEISRITKLQLEWAEKNPELVISQNGCNEQIRDGYEYVPTDYLPDEFIVLDLETTGLEADVDEIIEIAAIRYVKGHREHKTLESLIKPNQKISKFITKLTGITQEQLNTEGRELADFLPELRNFIGDLRIVTYNSKFDMAFLNKAYRKIGHDKLTNPVSCALKMMRKAYPDLDSYKLVDIAERGGFNNGKAHRALSDAQKACIAYAIAVNKLKKIR